MTLQTPLPPAATPRNSYSFIMRDGILDRLKHDPMFTSVAKWSKNRMKGPIQLENIPYFGCYLVDEIMSADGDSNAGAPKFIHMLRIGFSVVIISNDNELAEWNLDQAHWAIMNYLHRQDWFRFIPTPPGTNVDIEGIEKGSRKHVFGNRAGNNETPVAELQMDLTLKYRTYFEPYVPDDLDRIHVEVAPTWPYDPGAYVPPFIVEYDLTTIVTGQEEVVAQSWAVGPPIIAIVPLTVTVKLIAPSWAVGSPVFAMP